MRTHSDLYFLVVVGSIGWREIDASGCLQEGCEFLSLYWRRKCTYC
ncbi:MAG: hypothetical protein NXI22_07335 [bacterium]|nr:hypothetical protein [bacterium]